MKSVYEYLTERTISSKKVEQIDINELNKITKLNFKELNGEYIAEIDSEYYSDFLDFFVKNADLLYNYIADGYESQIHSSMSSQELWDIVSDMHGKMNIDFDTDYDDMSHDEQQISDNLWKADSVATSEVLVAELERQLEKAEFLQTPTHYRWLMAQEIFVITLTDEEVMYILEHRKPSENILIDFDIGKLIKDKQFLLGNKFKQYFIEEYKEL